MFLVARTHEQVLVEKLVRHCIGFSNRIRKSIFILLIVLDRHCMYESSCDRHMNDEIYKTF